MTRMLALQMLQILTFLLSYLVELHYRYSNSQAVLYPSFYPEIGYEHCSRMFIVDHYFIDAMHGCDLILSLL